MVEVDQVRLTAGKSAVFITQYAWLSTLIGYPFTRRTATLSCHLSMKLSSHQGHVFMSWHIFECEGPGLSTPLRAKLCHFHIVYVIRASWSQGSHTLLNLENSRSCWWLYSFLLAKQIRFDIRLTAVCVRPSCTLPTCLRTGLTQLNSSPRSLLTCLWTHRT